jgi:copper transport protein
LRRAIAAEAAVVLVILGVVAAWRFTPPPRALAVAAAPPAYVHLHGAAAMAMLSFTPAGVGPTSVTVELLTAEMQPLAVEEVTLSVAMPDRGIEALRRPAARSADGLWLVEGLVLPFAGSWTVRIDALASAYEAFHLEGTVEIVP